MLDLVLTTNMVLLVKGPAELSIDGQASIMGKDIADSKVLLKEVKLFPIETNSNCRISLSLSKHEQENEYQGNFWVYSPREVGTNIWEDVIQMIFCGMRTVPESILVTGPTDAGKTTLSTCIVNQAINRGLRPAIIDADVGQGDLAPPTAIGCGVVESQILDLRDVRTKYFEFVGNTNPSGYHRLISRLVWRLFNRLKKEKGDSGKVNMILINTDGYVTGDGLSGKIAIANKIMPEVIICLGEYASNLCVQIATKLWSEKIPILLNASSPLASYPILKSRQERERRRLDQFHRYITDFGISGKGKSFSLEKIRIVYKGLTYYKVFVTRNNDLILLGKKRTKRIMYNCIANMFVGLGRADNLVGFGIISKLAKHTITIHTGVEVLDMIYLSSTGISRQTWKPFTIDNNGRPRYCGSIKEDRNRPN
jgi:polynucleotide 5'-hydroxyl-kinase GRC3/NOL9